MDILNKRTTLVLNKSWQAVNEKTAAEALVGVYSGSFLALNICYHEESTPEMEPMDWDQWKNVEVKDGDFYVRTVKSKIKIPSVVICKKYNKIHLKKPTLTMDAIRRRDKDICQYSGKKIHPSQASVDHVVAASKGGKKTWENLVYCDKKINNKKGSKSVGEAGLKLQRQPFEPKPVTFSSLIEPRHEHWKLFL